VEGAHTGSASVISVLFSLIDVEIALTANVVSLLCSLLFSFSWTTSAKATNRTKQTSRQQLDNESKSDARLLIADARRQPEVEQVEPDLD